MRTLILLTFSLVLAAVAPACAGEIEVNGKWVKFTDIVPDAALDPMVPNPFKSVRILGLSGSRWSKTEGAFLSKRFWPLSNLNLTAKDGLTRPSSVVAYSLNEPFPTKNGWYGLEFRIVDKWKRTSELIGVIAEAAERDADDPIEMSCIELNGRLIWTGNAATGNPEKSRYMFTLIVESVKVAGKIPRGYYDEAPPVPNVEEATKLCSPEK